jgi:hypothetical protein
MTMAGYPINAFIPLVWDTSRGLAEVRVTA